MSSKITKILIANRGEIAVRIIKSARDLGYQTVAVFSKADQFAPHVELADEAYFLGASEASASYLDVDKVIQAAKETKANAIHPGYGFLSENPEFALACEKNSINFIGPSAKVIQLMADKGEAKAFAKKAGVPVIPGYEEESKSDNKLIEEAKDIGYPLMVKAAAGGGGKGMRIVAKESELRGAIESARNESKKAFNNDSLILEKALINARHIEIQVLADQFGHCLHLGERDCSIQRRHQKIVEECPSPAISESLREKMTTTALALTKACDYLGAGTVEFLLTEDESFYFLEMNTRLQVEHPITEQIYQQDLVAWQIKIADGQPLSLTQDELQATGHAIEVRLCAEDPLNQFLPQTGEIMLWDTPLVEEQKHHQPRQIYRVDCGIKSGQVISKYYDSMIAKLITYGVDRKECLTRANYLLDNSALLGLTTNKEYLRIILDHPVFVSGDYHTQFIEMHNDDLNSQAETVDAEDFLKAAIVMLDESVDQNKFKSNTGIQTYSSQLVIDEQKADVNLMLNNKHCTASLTLLNQEKGEQAPVVNCSFSFNKIDDHHYRYQMNNRLRTFAYAKNIDGIVIAKKNSSVLVKSISGSHSNYQDDDQGGDVFSQMEGLVIRINVESGQKVEKGDVLLYIEAMKMEQPIKASSSGTIEEIKVSEGMQVQKKQLLLTLNLDDE